MNAMRCGRCDELWYTCLDKTYVHGGKAKSKQQRSYTGWETEDDSFWGKEQKQSKSSRGNRTFRKFIAETTNPKITSKSMRQAVSKVDSARAKFKAAKAARQNLHTKWTEYVEQSVKRWRGFAEGFKTKDDALAKEVTAARDSLQEARIHLDEMKELHSKQDAQELQIEVSSDVDEKENEELIKMDTAEAIHQGITSMVDGLEKIRVRPAEESGEEQANAAKKART
eukprot:s1730_g6.t1